ncbi:DEAD/DEAH box helicase [Nocardioides sp. HDW12B]|uniref:DEAD/DEAH box helicase n=1 Tax=Nocardioides sp. HDW12B TaxID=2714939 RepID=UPI00197F6649|nr:DEAD/DEAH box helicase [Nocardioides sp. HDW12B]
MPGPRSFSDLGTPAEVVAVLREAGIETPTPVQSAVLPDALAGHDVLARARTGSGKTIAFAIPVVSRLAGRRSRMHRPRALVVVPTRELAVQVEGALRPIARAHRLRLATIYGGTRYDAQVAALRRASDIVVGTPGRLQDLIDQRVLRTDDLEVTVLDEADQLCDLGFHDAVDRLLAATPSTAQRLLLSATLDGDVDRLVRAHLRDPRRHDVDTGASVETMSHHVVVAATLGAKLEAAYELVGAEPRVVVFARTRRGATDLRTSFERRGLTAVDLHGDLPQHVRERNLARFREGRARVVVATDVAARGIHVDRIGLVVHFDPPIDAKAYLHRSGRTARAGESGAVVTLVLPRQLAGVVALQDEVAVSALFHDWTTTPRPPTVEALAASGAPTPPVVRPRSRGGRRRSAAARARGSATGPRSGNGEGAGPP